MLLFIMPFIALIFIFIVYGVWKCYKNQDQATFVRNVIVSIIVILYLAYPSLTSNAFSMMNCYQLLPGQQWLQADL